MDTNNQNQSFDADNSLEAPGTIIEAPATASPPSSATQQPMQVHPTPGTAESKPTGSPSGRVPLKQRLRKLLNAINIYLLLFVFIVIGSVGIAVFAAEKDRKAQETASITNQDLTPEILERLKNSDTKVGDPKQTLNVEANAVFTGKVLIRDSLDVAGPIKVGGALSLPGITVSGSSSFDSIRANSLNISSNASVLGQLNVQKNLVVSGGGSFGGQLSAPSLAIENLQLNRDLQLNRHIDAGGGTPSRSNGSALGGGGTTSVSGSDTAGTVNISTGSSPSAGCFVTVTFAQRFNATPHVVITPVGSAAAGLNYYISRTTTNFSICTTNAASASSSFSFDYLVID